jgi:hypothetical protein
VVDDFDPAAEIRIPSLSPSPSQVEWNNKYAAMSNATAAHMETVAAELGIPNIAIPSESDAKKLLTAIVTIPKQDIATEWAGIVAGLSPEFAESLAAKAATLGIDDINNPGNVGASVLVGLWNTEINEAA